MSWAANIEGGEALGFPRATFINPSPASRVWPGSVALVLHLEDSLTPSDNISVFREGEAPSPQTTALSLSYPVD